jgi:L-lactate utilization protein LutC
MASTLTTTQGQTYDNIPELIHTVRGLQVMLDSDVAKLYGYETRTLNQAANRNSDRFSEKFRFQLDEDETEIMISQFVISSKRKKSSAIFVYTAEGVAMLAGLLKSEVAILMSVKIIEAFVEMRKILTNSNSAEFRLSNIETKLVEYFPKIDQVFDAFQKGDFPSQKLFYKNSFYDTYDYVVKLIEQASTSIIIIDNYLDNSILEILSHKSAEVEATIITTNKSKLDKVAIESFNKQYSELRIVKDMSFHDRFIIVDKTDVRKFGASFKDLGKQIFGVDKINDEIMCKYFMERVNLIISGKSN